MARLGSFLLRASILVAVGWVWFNYANGYPMNAVSAEAGIYGADRNSALPSLACRPPKTKRRPPSRLIFAEQLSGTISANDGDAYDGRRTQLHAAGAGSP